MFDEIVSFIKDLYQGQQTIPLHEPRFWGNEKKYLNDCIDSTFVSSVGKYVDLFEENVAEYVGVKHAVAVVNGTQALYVALHLINAQKGKEVLTQALTFVATANAISYTGAEPIFLDVDKDTMGLSPESLRDFLENNTKSENGKCINKNSDNQIIACLPMHTLGLPCRIQEIKEICDEHKLILIEDAAESLGSYVGKKHTGSFGKLGILSFNGNKIITTGGGGMIITDDGELAARAKHLTTTAKTAHPWEFNHDEVGFNYRMPNLNAALGVAQMERLSGFLEKKREQATLYKEFFANRDIDYFTEPKNTRANYWLNTILFKNSQEKNTFLKYSNETGVMTRGLWTPMHHLPMYRDCQRDNLLYTEYFFDRVVNIPSSARLFPFPS